jgi:CubicO group peptidase (beta-lactamase class C family)
MRKGWRFLGVVSVLVVPGVLTGCGDAGGTGQEREEEVLSELAQELDGTLNLPESINAATATAQGSANCKANNNFYWEIGTRNGALASGSVVNAPLRAQFSATTSMGIASASKMVFAAYVSETCGGVPCTTPGNPVLAEDALRMVSGYVSSDFMCPNASINPNIDQCATAANIYDNGTYSTFSYSGGQFAAFAWGEEHLAGLNAVQLADEINTWLGTAFSYVAGNPWPAGGNVSTPANYAAFLQRILLSNVDYWNGLKLHGVLGLHKVDASASPVIPDDQDWEYSYGHWVENANGGSAAWDGAYSSPGSSGFYPWISRGKRVYGLVARTGGNFFQSVRCGQDIRRAFYRGQVQP